MPTPRQSRLPEPPGPQSTHFRHRFSRRGGYQPPEPHRRDHHGLRSTQPGHGGMRACRPTRFVGGAAGTAGLFGRPYRPPLRRGLDLVRRAGCPHPVKAGCRNHHGLRSTRPGHGGMRACRPTRFVGGCGGDRGRFWAAASRPYGGIRCGARCTDAKNRQVPKDLPILVRERRLELPRHRTHAPQTCLSTIPALSHF